MATPLLKHILIIDDNPGDVKMFRMILESEYLVNDAPTGKLGLQAINDGEFDLVILDISMPEVDGFEILRTIGQKTRRHRILVVSGLAQGNMLEIARKLGADLAIDKLVVPKLLLPSVAQLLEVSA
jgi:CheY-like chemotaxis protein